MLRYVFQYKFSILLAILIALLSLIIISSCVYIMVRTLLIAGNIGWDLNGFLAIALILGEMFIMFQSLAFCINLVGARNAQLPEVPELENPENEWMSQRFWTILGYDPKEKKHLASEWQDLIHPDDLQDAIGNLKKTL